MAATFSSSATCIVVLLAVSIFVSNVEAAGFTVDLIHRDSPRSPFYNPYETFMDRMSRAIRRSDARVNYFGSSSSTSEVSTSAIRSKVIPNGGEYLMSISIGTPAVEMLAVADTGSDLIWTQCKPCYNCYEQEAPLFDPKASSSYKPFPCISQDCLIVNGTSCNKNFNCLYSFEYGDRSFTTGVLSAETFTFGSGNNKPTVKIPSMTFGCGQNNGGMDSRSAGLVGLSGGNLSLISQLGPSIGGKFSYCLVPVDQTSASSRMSFGDDALVSGKGVVSTPLIIKDTFYYLSLKKLSVGGNSVNVPQDEGGNIMIDSGTTLTLLPIAVLNAFSSIFTKAIKLNRTTDPEGIFKYCYETGPQTSVPDVTFGFDGADLVLSSMNTFIQKTDRIACLTLVPSDSLYIFGNLAQMNFKVGYDVVRKKVSFQKTDCTKE